MNGLILAKGLAHAYDCPDTPYTIIQPVKDAANMRILTDELHRWGDTYSRYLDWAAHGQLTKDVSARAAFAVDTLSVVRSNIDIGVCCQIVAVDPDEHILAAMTFFILPPTGSSIGLVAVDPRHIPGSPFSTQYRGVGTAMVAAMAHRVLSLGVTKIALKPLDDEARRFWIARGFRPTSRGSVLTVEGKDAVRALADNCLLLPDSAVDDGYLLCGLPKQVRERLEVRR